MTRSNDIERDLTDLGAQRRQLGQAHLDRAIAAKPTPGPWRIGDAGRTVFGPPNGEPSPETIATCRSRANARLIATAPFMLQALEDVVRTLGNLPDIGGAYDQCVQAIALARGEKEY